MSEEALQEAARCVIVGGGAMGVGLLYHLAHEGWTDTVLVEKGELTSGSTWHAAGLVPNFTGSLSMAVVHNDTIELYKGLEAETGLSPGWHGCGAVRLAVTDDDVRWFHHVAGILTAAGVESHLIGHEQINELQPLLDLEGVKVGLYTPHDGWSDPTGSVNAMAKGARQLGAKVSRHNRVTDMNQLADGRWEVITEKGRIVAEHVVNAAGHYAPQLGAMVGLDVPVISMIHQYLVTEEMESVAELDFDLPVVRDPRASCYYRREINGLIVGPYEMSGARTYGLGGIDWDLDFHLTPPDLEPLLPWLELAAKRIPAFEHAGIKTIISGPITHTPDSGFLIGPAPGLRNYWHCNGASIGITQGPGAGKYLAQLMVHGQSEINIWSMDPRRFGPHCGPETDYIIDKAVEEYHAMYQPYLPGEHRFAGRPIKKSPVYDSLDDRGAVWEDVYGWERPQYYGEPEEHSFLHTAAFEAVAEECRGVANGVGIIDLTAFSKYEVTGAGLGELIANRLPTKDGGIRLAHFLYGPGGVRSEVTVTRLGEDRYYLNSPITAQRFDLDWMEAHGLDVRDVTDERSILGVTGPRAREALSALTDDDLSFGWLTAKEVTLAGVECLALRVSYVGELGWELHHPIEDQQRLYDAIVAAEPGITHFGSYAMNSMRMEKAYAGWGSELNCEATLAEAGMGRFVDPAKGVAAEATKKLVYLEVEPADCDATGSEPVFVGDKMVGVTTSGAYGHRVNKSLAFAYVEPGTGPEMEILIQGERRRATVLAEPVYDPSNERMRG